MIILHFAHRLMGAMWMFAGAAVVLASGLSVAAPDQLRQLALGDLPQIEAALQPVLGPSPSIVATVAGLVSGAYMMFVGAGLVSLRSWARLIGIASNAIIGACLVALTVGIVMYIPAGRISAPTMMVLAVSGVSAFAMLAFSAILGTQSAASLFAEPAPALPRLPAVKCPTCGGNLDLARARCPKCDAELERPIEPKRARLVELKSGKEYGVSLRKLNRIGREAPNLEISLEHRSVSGNHASIEYYQGRFYLHAHDDTFGTFVNQRRTRDSEIRNNDVLTFGQAEFRFIVDY
ncbi:MAG: FHA domain-containing protein [Candidatus Roseilinea sp.]|uniref:FHA domain-containing protein n=1 Tax=Candidatus Roseilinea sp. TaxID=2838777 RepID=UPI00404AB933